MLIGNSFSNVSLLISCPLITLIPVGAGSQIIFAKNGQSHKPAPSMYYGRSIGHDMSPKFIYSNPCRSRKFFTPPQPSPKSRGGSKKFTNDARIAIYISLVDRTAVAGDRQIKNNDKLDIHTHPPQATRAIQPDIFVLRD
jgi:hypothetical protein